MRSSRTWQLPCLLLLSSACASLSNEQAIDAALKSYREKNTNAPPEDIDKFKDILTKNLGDSKSVQEEKLNRRLNSLLPSGRVKRATKEELVAILDHLEGPPSLEFGFTLLMAHCLKMEAEKEHSLRVYRGWRWATLVTGAAAASTATVLTGVNDSNNVKISPDTHERLRISTLVFGSTGVLLSAVYGLVGFEERIDRANSDLNAIRRAIGNARSKWALTSITEEDKVNILLDMMANCNANSISEREIVRARTESVQKQVVSAIAVSDRAIEALEKLDDGKAIVESVLKSLRESVVDMEIEVKALASRYGGNIGKKLDGHLLSLRQSVDKLAAEPAQKKTAIDQAKAIKTLLEAVQNVGEK